MQRYSSLNSVIAFERRPVRHEVDGRVLAPAGNDEQREAGAGLLVVNAQRALLVDRHAGSLSRADCCGLNTSTARRRRR